MKVRCPAFTRRRGKLRRCGQHGYILVGGAYWCFYHNPLAPKKFGEGYKASRKEQP